jgi:tetratricopeptide (TPR) repeat protein
LEHLHDPAAALERYRTALRARPGGSLSEEARYGIANAYRALGRPESERAALQQFLEAHPHSLFAPVARARVTELTRVP